MENYNTTFTQSQPSPKVGQSPCPNLLSLPPAQPNPAHVQAGRLPLGGQAAPGVEKSGHLGTITLSLVGQKPGPKRDEKTQLYHDLLYAFKELLPEEHRVQACGEALVKDPRKPHKNYVSFDYAPNVNKVRNKDVCRCGYWWCPVCGPFEAELAAAGMREGFTLWGLAGYATVAGVFTLQHNQWESLDVIDSRLDKAIGKMLDSKPGRRFKEKWGIVSFQRSPDITYTFNGWHPHRNFVFFLKAPLMSPVVLGYFESELKKLWSEYCESAGGYADYNHGFKVLPGDAFSVADYIASKASGCGLGESQAHEHALRGQFGDGWGQAEELVKKQQKQARGVDSLTPTGILMAYVWGDDVILNSADGKQSRVLTRADLGRLYQEFAHNAKNKRLVYSLPGLKKYHLNPLKEQFKDELDQALKDPEEVKPDYSFTVDVSRRDWFDLVHERLQHKVSVILFESEGDINKIRQGYKELEIDFYIRGDGSPPAWWYGDEVTETQAQAIEEVYQIIGDFNEGRI